MNLKDNFKIAFSDRGYLIAFVGLVLVALIIILMGIFQIRPSELQVPVRYSSFGVTNFYRDRWYYLIGFVVFAVVVALMHVLISLKLYVAKGRQLSIAFIWLSVIMLTISAVFIYAILRVVSLSQ